LLDTPRLAVRIPARSALFLESNLDFEALLQALVLRKKVGALGKQASILVAKLNGRVQKELALNAESNTLLLHQLATKLASKLAD
jgi:hypothetical protein